MGILPLAASGSAAGVLFRDESINPAVEQAQARLQQTLASLDQYRGRLEDTDRLLGMSFLERNRRCNLDEMRATLWNQKREGYVRAATFLFFPIVLGGALAAPHLGLAPFGGMLLGGAAWVGLLKAVRHVVLPIHVDQAARKALKTERTALAGAVSNLQQAVQQAQADLDTATQAGLAHLDRRTPTAAVHVDEAAVTLGGVRIKVRKRL
ncbi:MAG: hypothetical protein AB1758_34440 [Candidatus Eremiobacterota bacterium]